jgi:hypothetical protein
LATLAYGDRRGVCSRDSAADATSGTGSSDAANAAQF